MKKKIFIITGMILCILAGIVIVPSVIRTRQAVKEFEKDFHASANSGADSAGIDSEDEPAAENEEVSEEEEKKAFELDTYLDHRDMTHRSYIYDMDYIEKAISFEKKSLQDFEEVIRQNPKIPDKFKHFNHQRYDISGFIITCKKQVIAGTAAHRSPEDDF